MTYNDVSADVQHEYILWLLCFATGALSVALFQLVYAPFFSSPLSRIPGPAAFVVTRWRLAYEDWKGTRTSYIHKLHLQYGNAVRIGPNEVSFNDLAALRTIYGAGSGFERDGFYRMFDVYGRQNLFTFASSKAHADRKKLLNHAYSKTTIMKGAMANMVEEKTRQFIRMLEYEPETASEIFTSLHYFAIDSITSFLYGDDHGGTSALKGSLSDRALLSDVMDPARRKLSWYAVHFPRYTKWLYTRTGAMKQIVTSIGMLPMQKPSTYTGIRAHALKSWQMFLAAPLEEKTESVKTTIVGRLWHCQQSDKGARLDDLDIASECADHLLAGIDTTSDTTMFLIWALSLPENIKFQQKLIDEISQLEESAMVQGGFPSVTAADKLPFLEAVIKETLRLYTPLPASEPRSLPIDCTVAGFLVPARTVVSMAPFSLHRNPKVFPDPLKFDPERWIRDTSDLTEMKRWWWAFSSGGRMCIGMHLAMAEMTTLVAAVYKNYSTKIQVRQKGISPGITSRFEVFSDETFAEVGEHTCWIDFKKLK
ncbi:Cytochrome P450 monooxygenase aflV [Lachnellula cervina]|uniref:Cytochrome P450 monooxygenase aflV n=1 Tax=Lachnellula cervina TaxID=1316786 RepID=A0A7D8UWE3_9HELO|nr:Cytochrome P450 monooxygenase aflV [Lachnellula cervina]